MPGAVSSFTDGQTGLHSPRTVRTQLFQCYYECRYRCRGMLRFTVCAWGCVFLYPLAVGLHPSKTVCASLFQSNVSIVNAVAC